MSAVVALAAVALTATVAWILLDAVPPTHDAAVPPVVSRPPDAPAGVPSAPGATDGEPASNVPPPRPPVVASDDSLASLLVVVEAPGWPPSDEDEPMPTPNLELNHAADGPGVPALSVDLAVDEPTRVDDLEPGTYLAALRIGRELIREQELRLAPGLNRFVADFFGVPWLRGRVIDADDRPVAGARVRLREAFGWSGADDLLAAVTRDDGTFVLVGVPPHLAYALLVEAPGFVRFDRRPLLVAEAGEHDLGTVVLTRERRVEGRVVDEEGEPVADVKVRASCSTPMAEARSDAEGRFVFERLSGPVTAVWTEDERAPASLCVNDLVEGPDLARTTPIVLVLRSGAWLTGTVRGPDGGPPRDAMVEARPAGGCPDGSYARSAWSQWTGVERDGTFRIGPFATAAVDVRVRRQSWRTVPVDEPVELVADEWSRVPLLVRLTERESGLPVATAGRYMTIAKGTDGGTSGIGPHRFRSRGDGVAELELVSLSMARDLRVLLSADGYHRVGVDGVLQAAASNAVLPVELVERERVRLIVRDDLERPLAGAQVRLFWPAGATQDDRYQAIFLEDGPQQVHSLFDREMRARTLVTDSEGGVETELTSASELRYQVRAEGHFALMGEIELPVSGAVELELTAMR